MLGSGLYSQSPAGMIEEIDPDLFPTEFFPGVMEISPQELMFAGLRTLYPNRILTEPPQTELPESSPPILRDLEGSGSYIRVRNLADALSVIEEGLTQPLLVLDFRFLTTDLESTIELGSLLTLQKSLTLQIVGDYPLEKDSSKPAVVIESAGLRKPGQTIFTLSNHETRGPIEALLAELKAADDIISVGSASAGGTASFKPFPNLESYFLIAGEIRPSDNRSIVASGFVPQVEVSVAPDDDRLAYSALREGVELDDLVEVRVKKTRFDEARLLRERNGESSQNSDQPDDAEEISQLPHDTILQRALQIVKALQALGRIPG